LTLLAPDIVEAVLDGRQPTEMTLGTLMERFAIEWTKQRDNLVSRMNPIAQA
jgi:hypothetical protein